MTNKKSFKRPGTATRFPCWQAALVILAFSIMIFSSYLFTSKNERAHLRKDALNILLDMQTNIESFLQEPELVVSGIAENIRLMILRGDSYDAVAQHITDLTEYLRTNERFTSYTLGVFGIFEVFGEKPVTAFGETPEGHVYSERSCYKNTDRENNQINITKPYLDTTLNVLTVTYTRRILDDEDNLLGMICFDLKFDKILEYLDKITQKKTTAAVVLLDSELTVIYHPDSALWGKNLRNTNYNIASLADDLEHNMEVYEYEVMSYKNDASVAFFQTLKNGWYIGIVQLKKEYYKSVNKLAEVLTTIGLILASALIILLLYVTRARDAASAKMYEAEASNQAKSRFLAAMSHEIRTPMNAILGTTEIQLQNETLTAEIKDAFLMINNSGDLLLNIINNILDFSKIESDKIDLVLAKYETSSLINDVVQLNIMRGIRQLDFEVRVDENTPSKLIGDESRIKQILNNLLSNAFKYTNRGSVKLLISVEDGRDETEIILVFRVSDTGQGMTPEQIDKLFDEYTRFNTDKNYSVEGIGLGMSITKNLTEMMRGTIMVESELGKGSVFTVRLPQRREGHEILGKELAENLAHYRKSKPTEMKRAQFIREYMPYGRVLVVDDVESNLYVAKGLMLPYGLSISTALSGFEAIDKIKSGEVFDIIFMDHMMAEMDGIEATRHIRDTGYTRPIVALTANAVAGQAEIFIANGFDDFISKPIDVRVLNDVLNKMIRNRQPPGVVAETRRQKLSVGEPEVEMLTTLIGTKPKLVAAFVRDIRKALAVLENILNKIDSASDTEWQSFTISAHGMKGALAYVGENALSDTALKLEYAGKNKDKETVLIQTPGFLDGLRGILQKISS